MHCKIVVVIIIIFIVIFLIFFVVLEVNPLVSANHNMFKLIIIAYEGC